jgi:hypothetical protein
MPEDIKQNNEEEEIQDFSSLKDISDQVESPLT